MKLCLNYLTGGVLLAAVMLAHPASAGEAAATASKPRKFDTPVWDPSAEWVIDGAYSGSGAAGDMDGPRLDFLGRRYPRVAGFSNMVLNESNDHVSQVYIADLDRIHKAAGSATGYLDGPFSRARFIAGGYSARGKTATSPDGRYVYMTEPWLGLCLRQIDYGRQQVRTLIKNVSILGLACGDKVPLYLLNKDYQIVMMDADAKVIREIKAQMPEGSTIGNWGCTLLLDEEKDRLYASRQASGQIDWFIWYWDLNDGTFHGVLPMTVGEYDPKTMKGWGPPRVGRGHLFGTFEGTGWYPELWIRFKPGDTERNHIWAGCTDMSNVWVLDLKAKQTHMLIRDGDKAVWAKPGADSYARLSVHGGFGWATDGTDDFYVPTNGGGPFIRYKRVK